MIKKYLNRTIAGFLTLIILFGLFPVYAFSQSSPLPSSDIKGFSRSVFDSHFSRADRELSPDLWLKEARTGLTQVINAWELSAGNLYDSRLLLTEARIELENWSNGELERRFSLWLMNRFFGGAALDTLTNLLVTFDETQKNLLWRLDDEGNILFDDRTGDPLIIRPHDSGREFTHDLAVWNSQAKSILINTEISFENSIIKLYPELLDYIPSELRATIGGIFYQSAAEISASIKREFENIAEREERIFSSRRTRDIWSLRSKNENEAARLFTERLIAETENANNAGIEELNILIEQASANTGDLALLGDEWLRLYKEQFDRGLKAWEEAEERFFMRRIEWEQDSMRLFSEGEEIWLTAFSQFDEERRKWELKVKELFQSGEIMFLNLSEEFDKKITEAKKEFDLNMEMRIGEGTARVKALIDMYLLCSSAAITAIDNIEYWLIQYNSGNKPHPKDANFSAWLNNEINRNPKNNVLSEIKNLYNLNVSYIDKALDARSRILENYAELLGTGLLKDILSSDASSEDFCLDEYQIALIRAKALVIYWERKTSVADAVKNYADELSAGRMTEAEGLRAWEEAKTAYNETLVIYEIELNKLNSAGEDVRRQQEILHDLTLLLQKEEELLNRLNMEYSSLVSSSVINNIDSILKNINIKYNNISEAYILFLKSQDEALYKNVIENGIKWGLAEQRETADIILNILNTAENLSKEEITLLNEEYNSLTSSSQAKIWNNTLDSLAALFGNYGLNTDINLIPDIKDISEAIFSLPGNYIYNAAEFLLMFNYCFTTIPKWLEYEINIWRNTFIQYTAAFAFNNDLIPVYNTSLLTLEYEYLLFQYYELYNYVISIENINADEAEIFNEDFLIIINNLETINNMNYITNIWEELNHESTENKKHWRQYLADEYIPENSPLLTAVSSWKEGILSDLSFNSSYYTNRLNDSFRLFSQRDLYDIDESSEYYYLMYSDGISGMNFLFDSLDLQYNDFLKLAETYKLSLSQTPNEIINQISIKMDEIKKQENTYNAIRNNFFYEAERMLNIGSNYDLQYAVLNKAYEISDQKRFEYEKQDAIQRWAGTAYLNTEDIDPQNSREKLIRAQTVLNVLSDLYNDESSRSNNNPEYEALYHAYEQTFNRKIKVLEAYELIFSEISKEQANNKILYAEYSNALNQLGNIDLNYTSYNFNKSRSEWTIKDIIMVQNGRLVFSRNDSMTLSGINESKANDIKNFLNTAFKPENEQFEISLYEDAVRGLSQRMAGYFNDPDKYLIWGIARNYLINSLINANNDLGFLKNYFSDLGQIASGGSLHSQTIDLKDELGKTNLYTAVRRNGIITNKENIFLAMWNSLSAEEKADLEFYTILTLTNKKDDYFFGFSQVYTMQVYSTAYNIVNNSYNHARSIINTWWLFPVSLFWIEMRDTNKAALNNINPVLNTTRDYVNRWRNDLRSNLSSIQNSALKYKESSNLLSILENITKPSSAIEWNDINYIFNHIKEINTQDISIIKSAWDLMLENNDLTFASVNEALTSLFHWTGSEEVRTGNALENFRKQEEQKQSQNENVLLAAVDNYVNGNINLNTLQSAAGDAFGENSSSWKNHFNNIHAVLVNNLSLYSTLDVNLNREFTVIADRLLSLTSQTMENRYYAEFSAREIEWNQTLNDLTEKFNEWRNTSALILENGRNDWIKGVQRMEEAYRQWKNNFLNEYERISYEWSHAYLAGLEDKEKWLEQAAYAANNASSESFLSLIGTEAERLTRVMDTREPFGIRDTVPQAQALMTELLQLSGIMNMANAFGSLNNIAGSSSALTRRGIGGVSVWNTAAVKTAASDLARQTNSEIANNEARKLAFNVRLTADNALRSLTENVETANHSFRSSIDEMFIFSGLWSKSGNNYVKEVVKGSTLFLPVISETVTVTGYINYMMKPVNLKTNLDENYLAVLDSLAINALLGNVFSEVQAIAEEIFGISKESIVINNYGKERVQSPGKFGAHIGYVPADKLSENPGKTRNEIFYDEGKGELGRLMADYLYWYVIDAMGNSELSLAPWDRRMWNDEGSFFKAPTLRSVGTIAGSIAAGIITGTAGLAVIPSVLMTAGIGSASNVVFGTLDTTFGYKTYDEALFDVGKSFIMNAAGGLIASGFNYLGDLSVLAKTSIQNYVIESVLLNGLQTSAAGLVSAGLSGITYSSKEGLGYNNDIFMSGINNIGTYVLTSFANTLVTNTLSAVNTGLNNNKLTGFNFNNINDLSALNGLLGSLAGQAVNLAMGNDFTINLFNLNFINGVNSPSGLLELRFGGDGITMSIGSGGANMSINNIIAAAKGIDVWSTNSKITNYGKKNEFESLITLRAQYGYGDDIQKKQLFDILSEDVLLNLYANENFSAKTINKDGQRIINLAGYQSGMSDEEQFHLALILGHEAYRDGYGIGEIDASGNLITYESNFNELIKASIARLAMGDRINAEHSWFYNLNVDFDLENYFLLNAKETGDYSMYYDYLEFIYYNDGDYFWQFTSTGNNYQNDNRYSEIPLFNALSRERSAEVNAERLNIAFEKYLLTLSEEERENPNQWDIFMNDKDAQIKNGYEKYDFISLYMYGCRFMSTKYILESVTGNTIDAVTLHAFIKDNDLFSGLSILTTDDIADVITKYSGGAFKAANINSTEKMTVEQLYALEQSNIMYLACLRVKGVNGGDHFVSLAGIDFEYDADGKPIGVSNISVSNPWNSNTDLGKLNYTFSEITGWDFFEIIPNAKLISQYPQSPLIERLRNIHEQTMQY